MNEIYLYKKNNNLSSTINVGLSYPSTYYYGMSVLGFLSLFKELDLNPNVAAQRIFLNTKAIAFEPKYLDLLGFSCVFELDILQILKIMKKYGFKLEAENRKKKTPLIFAGGPVITSNPEPYADFFDFMIIGDGEGIADEIVSVYLKNKNKSKKEILLALSKIKGVYVPALYKVRYSDEELAAFYPIEDGIERFIEKRSSSSTECLFSPIISENTFYSNTVFIELTRGCPFKCKFCTARWQNTPYRCYDLKSVKKAIKKAAKYAQKIVFIGAMITGHPDFDEICKYLLKLKEKRKFTVEFSSLSSEYLSEYIPNLIEDKTIALSVESGCEQSRYNIGKKLSNENLYNSINFYAKRGITKFNLYFIIGLPNETDENIDEYINFSLKLANKFKNITFCHIISTFTPKPATPFEREKRCSNSILKEYIEKIKKTFDENGIETILPTLHTDNFNALLSLGDRRLGKYINHIFEKNTPLKNMLKEYKLFMKKYNEKRLPADKLPHYSKYIYKIKTNNQLLPWEFIEFYKK